MSDLSKVLGDLYDAPEPAAPDTAAQNRFQPAAPEWADEERLDQAFSGWTPGPPADAPAAEREMSVVIDTPYVPAARLDEDLSATLSEALIDAGHDNHEPDVPVASAPMYELPGFDEEPMPLGHHVPAYEPAPVEEPPVEEPVAVVGTYVAEPVRPWTRAADDILPGKHGHSMKAPKVKEPKVKAPKAKKVKAPKPEAAPEAKAETAPKKFFGIQLRK